MHRCLRREVRSRSRQQWNINEADMFSCYLRVFAGPVAEHIAFRKYNEWHDRVCQKQKEDVGTDLAHLPVASLRVTVRALLAETTATIDLSVLTVSNLKVPPEERTTCSSRNWVPNSRQSHSSLTHGSHLS